MEVSNIWGLLAMPLGVLLCFGPALAAWLMAGDREEPASDEQRFGKRPER